MNEQDRAVNGHTVVSSEEELDDLPPVTVILDFENDAYQKTGSGYWSKDGDDGDWPTLPAQVIWTPPWAK